MKKNLLFLAILLLTCKSYSQIVFEKGYYINNSGEKIECLIRNVDWNYNPSEFEYKLSKNSKETKVYINEVKEFAITNVSKYIRSTVDIDRSSESISNLSNEKRPLFKKEKVFLKVLVEGKACLYEYNDKYNKRFFYKKENSNYIEQLIFKSYKIQPSGIAKNNRFRQQLFNDLKCETLTIKDIEKVDYYKSELINYFLKYNKCKNSSYVNYEEKLKRDLFNLTFRPRLNNSSLDIEYLTSSTYSTDFGNKINFGFGIEAEFIIPFNKNKWSFLIEPTYQYFKYDDIPEENYSGGQIFRNVNYNSIEIPVGLRYYLFLKENSKIFLNVLYVNEINFNSSIEFKAYNNVVIRSYEIKSDSNFALGLGYKYNDKLSIELRYLTNRSVLVNQSGADWSSNYQTTSLIFGYSIF